MQEELSVKDTTLTRAKPPRGSSPPKDSAMCLPRINQSTVSSEFCTSSSTPKLPDPSTISESNGFDYSPPLRAFYRRIRKEINSTSFLRFFHNAHQSIRLRPKRRCWIGSSFTPKGWRSSCTHNLPVIHDEPGSVYIRDSPKIAHSFDVSTPAFSSLNPSRTLGEEGDG
jgi:hypothetical protein